MFHVHYFYFRKSTASKYTYTPSGQFEIKQLIRGKPYWKHSSGATLQEKKTLVLADWSIESWSSEKRAQVSKRLIEALDAGFSIYAWQAGQLEELNKDNLLQLLKDPQILERMASPAAPQEIVDAAVAGLPNVVKDNVLVLNDYEIDGLLNPEVYKHPRELDVAKISKYQHDKARLIANLRKTKPPIARFNDTLVSEDSFQLLEKLRESFPDVTINTQFKSAVLTKEVVQALLTDKSATVARRTLQLSHLQFLEEVTLKDLPPDLLEKIAPYLSAVKKLSLLNCNYHSDFSDKTKIAFPSLERIKLLESTLLITNLVSIIKNSPQLRRLDVLGTAVKNNGAFTGIASTGIDTIKLQAGNFTKENYQQIIRQHKIRRIVFADTTIIANTLTELKDCDLSSIKIVEIENCSCSADYLDKMLGLLPQLEHLRIRKGASDFIESFTSTFALTSLKILEVDLKRFNEIVNSFNNVEIEQLILVGEKTGEVPQLGKLNLANMHYFRISDTQLDPDFLIDVLKRGSRLNHLDLRECTNLKLIADKLPLSSIETLNLSGTDITAESLERILEKMPKLKRLDLTGCKLINLTPKLRDLLNRKQVYYPDHVKAERRKTTFIVPLVDGNEPGTVSKPDSGLKSGKKIDSDNDEMDLDAAIKVDGNEPGTVSKPDSGLKSGKKIDSDSDEMDLDASTKYSGAKERELDAIFYPVDPKAVLPDVLLYRNKTYNTKEICETPCTIDKAFKIKCSGDLQLEPCSPKLCQTDVFKEASQLKDTPEQKHYYGKTSLTLSPKWQPLPSLSAQELLTHYHIEPSSAEVELQYSKRDNQYYIRNKKNTTSSISIDFLLKVPEQSETLPKNIQELVDYFAGTLSTPAFGKEALEIKKENPNGMDYMEAILDQRKGACRHRAVAFKHLMEKQFPSISVRIIENTYHMLVEVLINNQWIKCDLGGFAQKINLDISNNPHKRNEIRPDIGTRSSCAGLAPDFSLALGAGLASDVESESGKKIEPPSDEIDFDADTTLDDKKVFSVRVAFFPINPKLGIAPVSQYREKIYDDMGISKTPCSINKVFKLRHSGDLRLKPCSPIVCAADVFNESRQLKDTSDEKHYYGKTSLKLSPEWQPLPSLSAQELLTHYHIDPSSAEVDLQYSEKDNQYYIRNKKNSIEIVSIDFILKVPVQSKVLPKDIQELVKEFTGSSLKPEFGHGPLEVKKKNPNGMDYMEAILEQRKGDSRHRAAAFKHLMEKKFPSIPVRIITNTTRVHVELLIENEWIRCDLGSYPEKLHLNTEYDPRKNTETDLKAESLGDGSIDENDQFVPFLKTWKRNKQSELSLASYCKQLTEARQQKKYLIEVNNSVSGQALMLALDAYCKQNNKPVFSVKKPDDLICSAPYVTNKANVGVVNKGPGGPLHTFLSAEYDKANPPILIINAEQFEADDLVQHNSLFDDKPKADGTPLPEGTIVILLSNTSKPSSTPGEDLTSRMDLMESCPVPERALNMAYPLIAPKLAESVSKASKPIDLFHSSDWETLLLGAWVMDGNQFILEEGLLQRELKEHSVITIGNGLWKDDAFQLFWKEAKQNGFIDYEGTRIKLPKDFDLVVKEGYDWNTLSARVKFRAGWNPKVDCINPGLLKHFFYDYEYLETTQGMRKISGVIKKAAGKELVVNITRALKEDEWARLLTECDKHKVDLVCHYAPGLNLPKPLQHQLSESSEKKPLAVWDKKHSPSMIIKSTDRDTTVHQLLQQLPDSIFIDVSEFESYDLLGKVQGAYDEKNDKLLFTRVEKVLSTALKENKDIILTGQCSNELLDTLVPILMRRAQDPEAKGTVALVVDNQCQYSLPQASLHQVSVDEKVVILKKDFDLKSINRLTRNQLEDEGVSQLKARLRYFKRHPSESDSAKAWDGLKQLSTHLTLEHFDLDRSKEIAEELIEARRAEMRARLSDSPILYLSGLTAAGKTTFVEKYFKAPDIALYLGEDHIKNWALDKSDKLKVIFIDEANIGQRQWSEFEGLFHEKPSIVTRDGERYELTKNHVVIFAGNPLNYGSERQLAPLFDRHGNAMVFQPMMGEFIYELILKPLFADSGLQQHSKEVSLIVLALYRHLIHLSTNEVLISPRELQLIVLLTIAAYERGVDKDPAKIAAHYVYQIGSMLVPYDHKNDFDAAFKPKELLYPKQTESFKLKHSGYLITPSRQDLYQLIKDLLLLRKFKQGKGRNEAQKYGGLGGLVIEGEPGTGKSELFRAVLLEECFEGDARAHESKKGDQLITIPISMQGEQKMERLLRGLINAAVIMVDEINSAPILERWLNDILMNKNPVTKDYPEIPGAILLGTQNPPTMGGRKKASNALKRRILHYPVAPYPATEMVEILVNEGLSRVSAERLVRVYVDLVNYARRNFLSPAPTFRDVLRLARIATNLNNLQALNLFFAAIGERALREALMKAGVRFDTHTIMALTTHLKPETIRIFNLHISLFEHFIVQGMTEKKVQLMLRLLLLIMPKEGTIDASKMHIYKLLCTLKISQTTDLEQLLGIFDKNPELVERFFKACETVDCTVLIPFIVKNHEVPALIGALLDSPILPWCVADEGLVTFDGYPLKPDIQFASVETYYCLKQYKPDVKQSWEWVVRELQDNYLLELHNNIRTVGVHASGALFDSLFSKALLSALDDSMVISYINLMIKEKALRKLNTPAFCDTARVKKFIQKSRSMDALEMMEVMVQFQDYPDLMDYLLFSDEACYLLLKDKPAEYAALIKAYMAKKYAHSSREVYSALIQLQNTLNKLIPENGKAWQDILLAAEPKEIIQLSTFIKRCIAKKDFEKNNLLQVIDLYHNLYTMASKDSAIWEPVLLEASPVQIERLHRWMLRFGQSNKRLFFQLVYSRAHCLELNKAGGLSEDSLCNYVDRLLNESVVHLFDSSKPFQFSPERVQIIHHLEKKTFVIDAQSHIKGLWTKAQNNELLGIIYRFYSWILGNKTQDKSVLLLAADELTSIPVAHTYREINSNVYHDLAKTVSNYLGSFWIRSQRKVSAERLLSTINSKRGTYGSYKDILNAIQVARTEVFTNDTQHERNMHRFGSSRYYDTLNQLEDKLLFHWVNDDLAINSFKEYLDHYKVTLTHTQTCFEKAIVYENEHKRTRYDKNTKMEEFPGYIRALKKELDSRASSYQKYRQLLDVNAKEEKPSLNLG